MNRLKEMRKQTGTKATELASVLGVSVQAYYAYEKGEAKVSVETQGYEVEKVALDKASRYKKEIPTHEELVRFVKSVSDIRSKTEQEQKAIINRIVDKIIVYDDDRIEVRFRVIGSVGGHLSPPFESIILPIFGRIIRKAHP